MIFATLYIPSDFKKKKHEKQNTGVLHGSLKSEHQSGFNGGEMTVVLTVHVF